MTRETKAGLVVSCSFLCLVGVVLFSKLNDKETSGTENRSEGELAQLMAEPRPVSSDPAAPSPALPRQGENKGAEPTGVVPADYQVGNEPGNPKSQAVKLPSERPTPAPMTGQPDSSLAGAAPAKEEKAAPAMAPSPTPAPLSPWARTETGTPTTSAQESKVPGFGTPPLHPVKSMPTTGGTAIAAGPGEPAPSSSPPNAMEASDSAGGKGIKPTPSSVPGSPGPALGSQEGAVGSKPEPSAAPLATPASFPGPNSADTPKSTETGSAPPPTPKEWGTMDSTPRPDGLPPVQTPPERLKPTLPSPEPSASTTSIVPPPKGTTPGAFAGPAKATTPEFAWPRETRSPSGIEQKSPGSGSDFKTPETTNGNPPLGQSTTPLSAPRSSAGLPGSTQEFAPRPGRNGGLPFAGSSGDRDRSSLQVAAPVNPAPLQAPADNRIEKDVQLGSPAGAPLRPSPTMQTAAVPGPAGPNPPLGAPATSVSPPLAVSVPSGSSQSSAGGILQVESYDESTYICKANDTFRTISREFYPTGQYESALLLFNRNHPLATDALRQGSPVLQAGQPIYIPPARILEKYYGVPVSNTVPVAPPATPPVRPLRGPDVGGSVPQTNSYLAPASISVKPLPQPGSMPSYRVHEGGEMLREVARHTLGDADRWTDIYRLNPRFDPKEPVASGTVLWLPRDARVAPQDRP